MLYCTVLYYSATHTGRPDPTPWYTAYREEYANTMRFHEDEMIDHPVAIIVAVSSADPDPEALLGRLCYYILYIVYYILYIIHTLSLYVFMHILSFALH